MCSFLVCSFTLKSEVLSLDSNPEIMTFDFRLSTSDYLLTPKTLYRIRHSCFKCLVTKSK